MHSISPGELGLSPIMSLRAKRSNLRWDGRPAVVIPAYASQCADDGPGSESGVTNDRRGAMTAVRILCEAQMQLPHPCRNSVSLGGIRHLACAINDHDRQDALTSHPVSVGSSILLSVS